MWVRIASNRISSWLFRLPFDFGTSERLAVIVIFSSSSAVNEMLTEDDDAGDGVPRGLVRMAGDGVSEW